MLRGKALAPHLGRPRDHPPRQEGSPASALFTARTDSDRQVSEARSQLMDLPYFVALFRISFRLRDFGSDLTESPSRTTSPRPGSAFSGKGHSLTVSATQGSEKATSDSESEFEKRREERMRAVLARLNSDQTSEDRESPSDKRGQHVGGSSMESTCIQEVDEKCDDTSNQDDRATSLTSEDRHTPDQATVGDVMTTLCDVIADTSVGGSLADPASSRRSRRASNCVAM